jgi:hypothetical protein
MFITNKGIKIGPVLNNFHGILTGVPKALGVEGKHD